METDSPVSYSVPSTENLSPVEAALALRTVYADAVADTNHPHNNPGHFLNKDFGSAITRLHEIKCGPEPEAQTNADGQEIVESGQWPQAHLEAMEQGMTGMVDRKQAAQVTRFESATADMDTLCRSYNFERCHVPENITEHQTEMLRLQVLGETADFLTLTPMIENRLRKLNAPTYIQELGQSFYNSADFPDKGRQDILLPILNWINEAGKPKD